MDKTFLLTSRTEVMPLLGQAINIRRDLLALLVLAVLLLCARPALAQPRIQRVEEETFTQRAIFRVLEAITVGTFFALGAVVGSFLNVVVYRLPRGESVVWRPSGCPRCGTPIHPRDNIPIFAWFRLRGRCRSCQEPISARYPLVETLCGTLFLVLACVELLTGGGNLPVRPPNIYAGVLWIIWMTKWDLVGIYIYHLHLLCVALCITLIDRDNQRLPARLVIWGVTWGIVAPWCFPTLYPTMLGLSVWRGALEGALGMVAGILAYLAISAWRREQAPVVAAILMLAGAYLGWQAPVVLAASGTGLWGGLYFLGKLGVLHENPAPHSISTKVQILSRRQTPLLFILLVVYVLCWRWIYF